MACLDQYRSTWRVAGRSLATDWFTHGDENYKDRLCLNGGYRPIKVKSKDVYVCGTPDTGGPTLVCRNSLARLEM